MSSKSKLVFFLSKVLNNISMQHNAFKRSMHAKQDIKKKKKKKKKKCFTKTECVVNMQAIKSVYM